MDMVNLEPKGEFVVPQELKREEMVTSVFRFEVQLESKPKSPLFALKDGKNETGSKWQVEVKKDVLDGDGSRYLSVWFHMLSSSSEKMLVTLKAELVEGPSLLAETFVMNETGILELCAKDKEVCVGFERFVPLYKVIPPTVDPDATLYFKVTLVTLNERAFICTNNTPKPSKEKLILKSENYSLRQEEETVTCDAFLKLGEELFSVDAARLSTHSHVFRRYFEKEDAKSKPMEVDTYVERPFLLKVAIRFCHFGQLIVPKRFEGTVNILKLAKALEMLELKTLCQSHLLSDFLTVPNFLPLVTLAISGDLDPDVANPILMNFLVEKYDDLVSNEEFCENYKYYEFYFGLNLVVPQQGGYEELSMDVE